MEKEKEVFICFADDNLKNKQLRTASGGGSSRLGAALK